MTRSTPEGKIKDLVDKRLKQLTRIYRFMPVQTGMGARTLDYLLCANGFFVALETKAPGKDLTEIQKTTKQNIEAAGGYVFRVRDEDELTNVVKFLVAVGCEPLH